MSLSKFATPTRDCVVEEADNEEPFGGLLPKRRTRPVGYRRSHSMVGETGDELDNSVFATIRKRLNFEEAAAAATANDPVANTQPADAATADEQTAKVTKFDLTVFRRAKLTYTHGSGQVRFAHDFELDGTGKKGSITMTLLQLKGLLTYFRLFRTNLEHMDDEDADDVNLLQSLGGKVHLRLATPYTCVNIRTFERGRKGGLYATKKGVALRKAEFLKLETHMDALTQLLDEQGIDECYHGNYQAEVECPHCTPYPAGLNGGSDSDSY